MGSSLKSGVRGGDVHVRRRPVLGVLSLWAAGRIRGRPASGCVGGRSNVSRTILELPACARARAKRGGSAVRQQFRDHCFGAPQVARAEQVQMVEDVIEVVERAPGSDSRRASASPRRRRHRRKTRSPRTARSSRDPPRDRRNRLRDRRRPGFRPAAARRYRPTDRRGGAKRPGDDPRAVSESVRAASPRRAAARLGNRCARPARAADAAAGRERNAAQSSLHPLTCGVIPIVLSRCQPKRGAVVACMRASARPSEASRPPSTISSHSSARNSAPSCRPMANTRGTRIAPVCAIAASASASAASPK